MEKKLKIQMNGRSDEFGTPKEAIDILLPYLKKDWILWECAWGKGSLAKHLEKEGFEVIGEPFKDFLNKSYRLNKYILYWKLCFFYLLILVKSLKKNEYKINLNCIFK